MSHDIEKLRHEIDELERQIASHPFEGLFDRKRLDQLHDRLKKKRKELARMEAGPGEPALSPEIEDVVVPDLVAGIEETPDMGHDMPVNLELDDEPVRRPSPAARPVAKKSLPHKKTPKPAKKHATKPAKKKSTPVKSKPKSIGSKKGAKKLPKKKSKR